MPVLELRAISKRYDGVPALSGVDFTVEAGEVVGLVGENGAGKSTLIKIVAGAVAPDAGEIWIEGRRARFGSPADAMRAGIAVIYQELSLAATLDATENVLLGGLPTRGPFVDWTAARAAARRWLDELMPGIPVDVPVREMPIAQRQLVEVARALARRARLLFMDEPTASLSEREAERLLATTRSLAAGGVSVVFVTHRLEEALQVCDRIVVLRDGRRVGSLTRTDATRDKLIELMVGRIAQPEEPATPSPDAPAVLEVRDLDLPGRLVGISLQVRAGEVLGLAGLVGAGRSSLLRTLFGAEQPARGTILLDGRPIRLRSPADAIRLGIAFIPEDRRGLGLFPALSCGENLAAASWPDLARHGFLWGRAVTALATEQVRALDIRLRSLGQGVLTLSGGNQQKVVLGRWLARRPRILLMDEPTRGVDVGAKAEIYALIQQQASAGVAILLSTSELPELLSLANRLVVIREGRLVATLPGGVSQETIMRLATGATKALA